MSIAGLLASHQKDLGGGLIVRRVLPAAARQSVGPFVFFDHFGPLDVPADANHDVRPHPHIGLATVTYLFEGAMEHRDSIGSVQRIEPGAINWMSSGRGIVHSERTPKDLAGQPRRSHGLQLWAALPRANEEDPPSFSHTPAAALPEALLDGAGVRVLIGRAFGLVSPVATLSETLYLDMRQQAGQSFALESLAPEMAIYPVSGQIDIDGVALAPFTMAWLTPGEVVTISASSAAHWVVIGGAPLDGPRFIWWNFVSSRKERVLQAGDDWQAQRMGSVPGDTELIPLPARAR